MGRDVDGDGLCFEWEARLYDVKPGTTIASSCGCVEPDQGNIACDSHREYKKQLPDRGHRLRIDDYKRWVDDSQVRVETGMQWTNAIAPSDCNEPGVPHVLQDGITITVKNCKRNPRVVQFIHREQKLLSETLEEGQYERSTGCTTPPRLLSLTDDRGTAWYPDGTPYYNSYRMDCDAKKVDSMTIFDAPNFKEGQFDPQRHKYFRATFVSFVLCDGQIVRQIRWHRTLEADKEKPGALKKTYEVEKDNVMPDAKDVKKFQCMSKPQWASCSAMGPDSASCGSSR